jgi:undecaprenyl-diphosphatase
MTNKKKIVLGIVALILGMLGIISLMLFFSNFINDDVDWAILLVINPDVYIPFIDELMVFITNCSIAIFAVGFVFWEIGYGIYKKDQSKQKAIYRFELLIGILTATIGSVIILIVYDYKMVALIFSTVVIIGFWMIAKTFLIFKIEYLDKFSVALTMVVIAIVLNSALSEWIVKDIVQRPRPLNIYYSAYNSAVRVLSDAITASGYSYVSGHSSALFALVTPIVWLVKNRKVKAVFIIWGALHAFTRVYVAAHFPLCITMGSIMGILYGTLAYFVVSYWFPQGLQYLMEKKKKVT